MRHQGGPRMGGWHRRRHHLRRSARLMERFDTNADGKLTQKELNDSRSAMLAKYDANKDGKLSLKEFEGLWLEFTQRRMVRSFQRLDVDGDASVTLDEYLKPFAKIVERLDRNEDGALSREDRRWRRWHHRGGGPGAGRGGPAGGSPATPPGKN
jgi:Ca2+-binding EF-hand superfamily protein